MRLYKISTTAVLALSLAGCGLFAKDRLEIDGERIPVLETRQTVTADYMAGDINIVLPAPVKNEAWTQTGGNAGHNMGHPNSGEKLQKQWSESFGKGASGRDYLLAAPIIAGEFVFTIDADATVSAFRQADGKRLWKRRLKPQLREDKDVSLKGAGLAWYDGTVFATTGFGGVFALNPADGSVKWQHFLPAPLRIAPTTGGGKVFVQTIDNLLAALDAKTGSEIWRYAAAKEETGKIGGAAPAYSKADDVLIAGFSNGELRALKASTGSPLWSDYLVSANRTNLLADINSILASPVIAGDVVFAAGSNNLLVAIDLRSGQRIWEREIGSANMPWLAGKYLFVLANDGRLMAVEADSGKVIWDTKIPAGNDVSDQVGVVFAGPLLTGNRLLVNSSNGYAFYVSPYTGKILGYIELDGGSSLPPVAAAGMVAFATGDADIVVYR